jgi:hypothetical protein
MKSPCLDFVKESLMGSFLGAILFMVLMGFPWSPLSSKFGFVLALGTDWPRDWAFIKVSIAGAVVGFFLGGVYGLWDYFATQRANKKLTHPESRNDG